MSAPNGNIAASATVNVKSGSLTMNGWTDFGNGSSGTCVFNQSGGVVTNKNNLWIGRDNNGTATYNLSGGTLRQEGGTLDLGETNGKTDKGVMKVTGSGIISSTVNINVGRNAIGELTMSSSKSITTSQHMYVGNGNSARGTVTQTKGTVTVGGANGKHLYIGYGENAAGFYKITGGTLKTGNYKDYMYIGNSGRGVLDASSTVTATKAGYGLLVGAASGGRGELRMRKGTLTTSFVKKNNAGAYGGAAFGGSGTVTITAKQNNTTFLKDLNALVFTPGYLTTIGGGGYNLTVTNNNMFASSGAQIAKTGAGMVTIDRLPPVDDIAINAGTISLSRDNVFVRPAVNAEAGNEFPDSPSDKLKANNYLLHRWNFNGHGLDLIGSNHANLTGTGSITYINGGTAVNLPGGVRGTGWIDCGSSAVPVDNTPFTIEIWTTYNSYQKWLRIVSFGNNSTSSDGSGLNTGAMLAFNNGSDPGKFYIGVYPTATSGVKAATDVALTAGTTYHVALVFLPQSNGKWTIKSYVYDSEGTLTTSTSNTDSDWTPSLVTATHLWLGHSHWTADYDAGASYDEVRVWNVALSQAQIVANGTLGPDVLPVLSATSTLGVTENITVASGATLDLGGHSLTLPSLTGAGTVQNGTIAVGGVGTVGTMVLNGVTIADNATIRIDNGDTLTTTTENFDLSGATIDLAFTPTAEYTLATASGSGTFAGVPALTINGASLRGWKVKVSADGKTLRVSKTAPVIMVL